MSPQFALEPTGGQAMITRFECPNLTSMLIVVALHTWIKRDVKRVTDGFLGAVMVRDWRTRTVLSISLWRQIDSVYSMGGVDPHIKASRLPARLGITTRCGVFCYAGDWRQVMFGAGEPKPSPLASPDNQVRNR